jgi:hypothetical protein
MSPGRIAAFLVAIFMVAPALAQTTPLTCGQPNTQGTAACFSPATNLQATDIISGMQATGPQRSPQSVRITPAQIVAAGSGGAGGSLTVTDGTHTIANTTRITVFGGTVGGTTPNATLTVTGGSSITWPASTDLVISNGTNSPAGLAPINGDCVVGSGGAWTAAACPGGGGISGPGTTVNNFVPLWNGTTGSALSAGFGLGTGIQTALGVNVGSAGAPVLLGGAGGTPSSLTLTNATGLPNAGLATQTANTVLGALTATTPSGLAMPSCSGATNALIWTSGSGFGCNTITGGSATSITPGTTTVTGATAPCVIENTGTTVMGCTAETGTGSFVRATSPTLVTPALGTPASGVATNLTGTAASLTAGTATVANGLKSATTTVSTSAATAPTNGQVLTATSGTTATWQTPSSGSVSITSLTPNIVVTPSPITGTGTIASVVPLSAQTGTYPIVDGDNTKVITGASALTITPPGTGGSFLAGWGASILGMSGGSTLTPSGGSTAGGLAVVALDAGQFASIAVDGSNYDLALGIPPSGTQNKVLATPNGSTGQPKLRALVAADIPSIPISTGVSGLGTNVATALAATLSAAGGVSSTIASGTSAMGTSAISSAACATAVTTTATNTATTDVISWGFNGDPTGVTGYAPVTTGALTIFAYPSANNVNFKVCNLTNASVTPGAITLNWRVVR